MLAAFTDELEKIAVAAWKATPARMAMTAQRVMPHMPSGTQTGMMQALSPQRAALSTPSMNAAPGRQSLGQGGAFAQSVQGATQQHLQHATTPGTNPVGLDAAITSRGAFRAGNPSAPGVGSFANRPGSRPNVKSVATQRAATPMGASPARPMPLPGM